MYLTYDFIVLKIYITHVHIFLHFKGSNTKISHTGSAGGERRDRAFIFFLTLFFYSSLQAYKCANIAH